MDNNRYIILSIENYDDIISKELNFKQWKLVHNNDNQFIYAIDIKIINKFELKECKLILKDNLSILCIPTINNDMRLYNHIPIYKLNDLINEINKLMNEYSYSKVYFNDCYGSLIKIQRDNKINELINE